MSSAYLPCSTIDCIFFANPGLQGRCSFCSNEGKRRAPPPAVRRHVARPCYIGALNGDLLQMVLKKVVADERHALHGVAAIHLVSKAWRSALDSCAYVLLNLPLGRRLTPVQVVALFHGGRKGLRAQELSLCRVDTRCHLHGSLTAASGPLGWHYTALRTLHLADIAWSGALFCVAELATSLTELNLARCPIPELLVGIERLECLEHLTIVACHGVQSVGAAFRCPQLRRLSLGDMHDISFETANARCEPCAAHPMSLMSSTLPSLIAHSTHIGVPTHSSVCPATNHAVQAETRWGPINSRSS